MLTETVQSYCSLAEEAESGPTVLGIRSAIESASLLSKPRSLVHSWTSIVNDTVFNTGNLLREEFPLLLPKKKKKDNYMR